MLATTRKNSNAATILLFLHKLIEVRNVAWSHAAFRSMYPYFALRKVFKEYFKELEEESIRDNFVIIYELLDEMMDFGYPQTTESKILQE